MDQLVQLIMDAYGLPKKQAIEIAGQVLSERQGFEAMDSKDAVAYRDSMRSGTRREFSPNTSSRPDPGLGRDMISNDVHDLSRVMGKGLKPTVSMFAGLRPEEIAQAIGGAGENAYTRKKYDESLMLSRRIARALSEANDKNLAEARKGMNLPKGAVLIDPEAELSMTPKWNDPSLQLLPRAPVLQSEEERLRDRLFRKVY